MNTMNIKTIVENQNVAKFSHAISGVLYYEVKTQNGDKYLFPVDMNDKEDVGTSTFPCEIKAITLMRYIRKDISSENLIKIL